MMIENEDFCLQKKRKKTKRKRKKRVKPAVNVVWSKKIFGAKTGIKQVLETQLMMMVMMMINNCYFVFYTCRVKKQNDCCAELTSSNRPIDTWFKRPGWAGERFKWSTIVAGDRKCRQDSGQRTKARRTRKEWRKKRVVSSNKCKCIQSAERRNKLAIFLFSVAFHCRP